MLESSLVRAVLPRLFRRGFSSVLLLGLLLAAAGCQHRFPSERIPSSKWLILPFDQPEAMGQTPQAIRGWWLGARTIRQNERAGDLMAEVLNRRMANELSFVNLFSPIDIKYYFANKARRLKETFDEQGRDLTDEEVAKLMDRVPKIDFARDLGADKLLTGTIARHHMGEHRTIHWWWSVLDAEVQVIDVATGKVEWSRRYDLRGQFASMRSMEEELASRLIADLKREYFLPLARQ